MKRSELFAQFQYQQREFEDTNAHIVTLRKHYHKAKDLANELGRDLKVAKESAESQKEKLKELKEMIDEVDMRRN